LTNYKNNSQNSDYGSSSCSTEVSDIEDTDVSDEDNMTDGEYEQQSRSSSSDALLSDVEPDLDQHENSDESVMDGNANQVIQIDGDIDADDVRRINEVIDGVVVYQQYQGNNLYIFFVIVKLFFIVFFKQ